MANAETNLPDVALSQLEPTDSVSIKTSDGIDLATDIYLPSGSRRVGSVIVRLPYGKRGPIAFLPGLAELVTERGWALVAQDVRGKFDSTGGLDPFIHEQSDGWDTIEWVTSQPWSDGRVVGAGDSYFGYTAWAMAASGHQALQGLMVRVTSPNIRRDWLSRGGVFLLGNMTEWAASTWMAPEWNDVVLDWSTRPLIEILPIAFSGRRCEPYDMWISDSADWSRVNLDIRKLVQRPLIISHVGGWWDIFQRGQMRTWSEAKANDRRGVHLLTMDAVDHVLDPYLQPGEKGVDVVADPVLRRAGLPQEWGPLLEILDHLDQRSDLPRPVRWRSGLGEWSSDDQWPPRGSSDLRLYLIEGQSATQTPEGGILTNKPLAGHAAHWIHDPRDPVPTVETDLWRPLLSAGDHSIIHSRPDVLTFTSSVLPRGLALAGPARLRATVSSSAPSSHLMATLCHVWPDGTARPFAEGAVRFETDGESTQVTVDLGHVGYRVPKGDRIRLVVAASSFPRYSLHPGNAQSEFLATAFNPVHMTLGGGRDSELQMTIAPG